jgi:2-keto-4-pentenoate hydratase
MMTPEAIREAALALRAAAATHEYIAPLRETWPGITIDEAYAIQLENVRWKLAQGARVTGRKIGLTSLAVQKQLGVDQPDFGTLFDDMCYGDGETVPLATLTQPKIEAEIAFVMGRDLDCANPGTADVLRAIDYALPALEIVGSRVKDWNIRIVDTVADNASSSSFVLGTTPVRLDQVDLRLCGMSLERRGELVSSGAGAACLGHPLNAVAWLAKTMTRMGTPLRAGDVVLSGALGPMVPVVAGDVFEARVSGIGAVRAVFESTAGGNDE